MADSRAYLRVEAWVRTVALPERFGGMQFEERRLELGIKIDGSRALHEFDAVSVDGKIVVSVKSGHGRTRTGKEPTGQLMSAHSEALLLSLLEGRRTILAFTDEGLYRRFCRKWDGLIPKGVEILHIPLPRSERMALLPAQTASSSEGATIDTLGGVRGQPDP